jgi:hypothetical protein
LLRANLGKPGDAELRGYVNPTPVTFGFICQSSRQSFYHQDKSFGGFLFAANVPMTALLYRYKRRMLTMRYALLALFAASLLPLAACSPKIYGSLQLVDVNQQPIPPAKESPEGTVVNMINMTATLEEASHAVNVNAAGKYESEKGKIAPGLYRVEASRIGFHTETQTMKVGRFLGRKVDLTLKKIAEGTRKSSEASRSDEDKIVNPGEVNIQPPTM